MQRYPHLPTAAMTNLIAAVRSVLTYIVVSIYVLIAGPIALAIGVGFKNKTALYVPGHIGVGLALGLAGIRYRVRGREHIPHESRRRVLLESREQRRSAGVVPGAAQAPARPVQGRADQAAGAGRA